MRSSALAILALAPTLLSAQEPVLFAQNLDLRFQQSQINGANASATHGVYDFAVGLPVVTYRLGAIAFTGSISWDRVTSHGDTYQADSAYAFASQGVRINLFPYQPFKVRLDYTRSQSPSLFGVSPFRGDTLGVELGYGGRRIQNLVLTYRRSSLHQDERKESWSTLTLVGLQRFRSTEVTLQAQRQEFQATAYAPAWQSTTAVVRTETEFSPSWRLRTVENLDHYLGGRWVDGEATLQGISAPWSILSTVGYRGTWSGSYQSTSETVGQTLVWGHDRWALSGSGAFSRLQDNQGGSFQNGSFIGGFNALIAGNWSVVGSVATTNLSSSSLDGPHGANSYQIGLVRGGELPDLVRHSLYLVSDWSFERRRSEIYPPGYLPPELADQIVQRRLRQQGSLAFSVDLGRTQQRGGDGAMDWARIAGDVAAGGRFRMLLVGDYRKDDGFSQAGVQTTTKALTGNANYSMGWGSLTGTLGLTQNEQAGAGATGTLPDAGSHQANQLGTTRFEGAGLTFRLGKVPMGLLWTRLDPGNGPRSRAVSTYMDVIFRQISFRVTYSEARQDEGFHSRQVMISLRRFFDTVALW